MCYTDKIMKRISAFISYSTSDCNYKAQTLKEDILKRYLGFDSFIAHNDIAGGKQFDEMIKDQIKKADIFFVLVSKNAKQSVYVNQEIGMAIGYNKPIIPIKVDENPFGFIANLQALNFPKQRSTVDNVWFQYVKISTVIFYPLFKDATIMYLRETLFESLLFALSKSTTFYTANTVGQHILSALDISSFSGKYDSYICQTINENSFAKNEVYILPKLKRKLQCC